MQDATQIMKPQPAIWSYKKVDALSFASLADLIEERPYKGIAIDLSFVPELRPRATPEVIRRHSYLDGKVEGFSGLGYNVLLKQTVNYVGPTAKVSLDDFIKAEQMKQLIMKGIIGESGIPNDMNHEMIARVVVLSELDQINYKGITAEELRKMSYDKMNIEWVKWETENGFGDYSTLESNFYRDEDERK